MLFRSAKSHSLSRFRHQPRRHLHARGLLFPQYQAACTSARHARTHRHHRLRRPPFMATQPIAQHHHFDNCLYGHAAICFCVTRKAGRAPTRPKMWERRIPTRQLKWGNVSFPYYSTDREDLLLRMSQNAFRPHVPQFSTDFVQRQEGTFRQFY